LLIIQKGAVTNTWNEKWNSTLRVYFNDLMRTDVKWILYLCSSMCISEGLNSCRGWRKQYSSLPFNYCFMILHNGVQEAAMSSSSETHALRLQITFTMLLEQITKTTKLLFSTSYFLFFGRESMISNFILHL
jgi:hypothetical protein